MLPLLFASCSWKPDAALACPTSKTSLQRKVALLGAVRTDVLTAEERRYPVNEVYADLTPRPRGPIGLAELAQELFSADVFSMQTGVFRTPAMAF
eukprot:7259994-Prymnesium_polylepis.1